MSEHKEFEKYAKKHHRINSLYYHDYAKAMTPYIIEERQMNVAQMDVFSRLMMDRIIFMGTGIDDQVANIIQAQLLFLESVDPKRDVISSIQHFNCSLIIVSSLAQRPWRNKEKKCWQNNSKIRW